MGKKREGRKETRTRKTYLETVMHVHVLIDSIKMLIPYKHAKWV